MKIKKKTIFIIIKMTELKREKKKDSIYNNNRNIVFIKIVITIQ